MALSCLALYFMIATTCESQNRSRQQHPPFRKHPTVATEIGQGSTEGRGITIQYTMPAGASVTFATVQACWLYSEVTQQVGANIVNLYGLTLLNRTPLNVVLSFRAFAIKSLPAESGQETKTQFSANI